MEEEVYFIVEETVTVRGYSTPMVRNPPLSNLKKYCRIRDLRVEVIKRRAERLFNKFLSPAQKDEYDETKYITVIGNKGGVYRLNTNINSFNVTKIGQKRTKFFRWFFGVTRIGCSYCLLLYNVGIPSFDHYLAQKILIETDEKRFLSVACCSRFGVGH